MAYAFFSCRTLFTVYSFLMIKISLKSLLCMRHPAKHIYVPTDIVVENITFGARLPGSTSRLYYKLWEFGKVI